MRDILPEVESWREQGKPAALATVVKVWGSAPRPLGSKMAVTSQGDMAGSVSGGCIEGAVYEEAQAVLASGEPKRVEFGVSDETAWSVGLSCGGQIEVFLERIHPAANPDLLARLIGHLEAGELAAVVSVVGGAGLGRQRLIRPGEPAFGSLGSDDLDAAADRMAAEGLGSFASRRETVREQMAPIDLFCDVHSPPPKLIVVGAVHAAIHLVRFARELGYRTVVVDPRTAFATPERFADADELDTRWPEEALADHGLDEATCVATLSHDMKLDLPALEAALRSPARYIGALGSKRTHAKRVERLKDAGFSNDEIARIHSPIGLDLGGRRANEIALAVMAEIVASGYRREPMR